MRNPNLATLGPMLDGYERCARHRPTDHAEQYGTPVRILQRLLPYFTAPGEHTDATDLDEVGHMLIGLENAFPHTAREASQTMQTVRATMLRCHGDRWIALRSFHSYALTLLILAAAETQPDGDTTVPAHDSTRRA